MNASPIENTPVFVMVQIKDLGRFMDLTANRTLKLSDSALLLKLMQHTHTYSGRVLVTAKRLAEELQVQESAVRAGLARLQKQHFLRRVKNPDTGERYYRLNPWMVQSAKGNLLGLAEKEFTEA